MKLFLKTVQDVVAKQKDEILRVWVVTPKVFFSHVKTPEDLQYIYNNVKEIQPNIHRFMLEAFESFSDWKFPEEIFNSFCHWHPKSQLFLEKLAEHPAWLLKQLITPKAKSQFIELLQNNSEKKLLIQSYFVVLANELIKPEWSSVWPAAVRLFDKELWLAYFKKIKSTDSNLSPFFTVLLQQYPELLFPLFEHFFYQDNKIQTQIFSNFFLLKLKSQETATETQVEQFKLLYLSHKSNLMQTVSAQTHLHLIKLFPDFFEQLTSLFFNEQYFHALKLSLELLKKLALGLPSDSRGLFLLRCLQAFKQYQTPAFNIEDQVFFVRFCCAQIGEHDAALAFYLLEHHWQDTLKWDSRSQEEIIKPCSDKSLQIFANSEKRLSYYLTTKQTELFTLLANRLNKKSMQSAINKTALKLFADQNRPYLNEVIIGLSDCAFISWITINGHFSFDNRELAERLSSIILSRHFTAKQYPELSDYLNQSNQEVFNYFTKNTQRKFNFFTRLDQNSDLKKCFENQVKQLNLQDEIHLLELKLEFTRSDLSLKMLSKALQLWENRTVTAKPKFYFWASALQTPKFISDLQLFCLRWKQEHGPSNESINDDQKIVLHVLLQDWQRERRNYEKSTVQTVEFIAELLKSINGFYEHNTAMEMVVEKPVDYRLNRLRAILTEVKTVAENIAPETTRTINALIHIEQNHENILQFFQLNYKGKYQIQEWNTQIHTDHIPEGHTDEYAQYLKRLIDTFIGAFDLAKSLNKVLEFSHKLRGGVCLDQLLEPAFQWANLHAEDPHKVNLNEFIEAGYREALAFSKVLGNPEIKNQLQAEQLAQFITEHHGVPVCHENIYKIDIVDQNAIIKYAKEVLHLESVARKPLFFYFLSHQVS